MRRININMERCRIIFFDLEFYVPTESRREGGFCYNPWDKKSKLLGGSFLSLSPTNDFTQEDSYLNEMIQPLWLWNHDSERSLLENIFGYMEKILQFVSKDNSPSVSPLLCGIGITTSDVPVLFELFKRYKILSNAEAFQFQSQFRSIDLSQVAIGVFNHKHDFLYPKTKGNLTTKYFGSNVFDDGRSVWDLYERQCLSEIEERTHAEVLYTLKLYSSILRDFRQSKKHERRIQNLEKLLVKFKSKS
ncbi:hypothetical protein [Arenicella xantha]|nr:hypothetical protein [Arenicella xantha]